MTAACLLDVIYLASDWIVTEPEMRPVGTKIVPELVYDLGLSLPLPGLSDGELLQQQYSGLVGSRGSTDVPHRWGGHCTAVLPLPR